MEAPSKGRNIVCVAAILDFQKWLPQKERFSCISASKRYKLDLKLYFYVFGPHKFTYGVFKSIFQTYLLFTANYYSKRGADTKF